jgi:hypothetical protein
MTQDEIIEMGVQAGIRRDVLVLGRNLELLIDFAKLVAAKEREACAKVCEAMNKYMDDGDECAAAIRARGEQA